MSAEIQWKLKRMQEGEPPRVLDLFSGCGGMSLGFLRAGCEVVGGVEIDPHAALSHQQNFHPHVPLAIARAHAAPKDITITRPQDLLQEYGHRFAHETVDILVGGPPCPTFTRVGRAKLREVHQDPLAFLNDPRSQLYLPYLQYVEALRPVALLMENVPDFLNWGGHNLAEEICDVLEGLDYDCSYTLLNAANHGVPQLRERFFLMAIHRAAGAAPVFPAPTHHVDLPKGYVGVRSVALKGLESLGATRHIHVSPPPVAPTAVTARDAIGDLPPIMSHLDGTLRRGARRFDVAVGLPQQASLSEFARDMRTWTGFESDGYVRDHVIRSLGDRDFRIFRAMDPGDDYPRAHALGLRLFGQAAAELQARGQLPPEDSHEYEMLRRDYVPPYDAGKFPNKWRKMEADSPVRTLMAHLGKDTYSHIHYDNRQARVISVREAARLQSFPDGFRFAGTMNPAFRQIGNAVPPLLARHLGATMLALIGVRERALAAVGV